MKGFVIMNRILPIGSVVLLKDTSQPVMIFGYLQESLSTNKELYDYIGVPYPMGNISIKSQIGFQMTSIREVLFEGYKTEDFKPIEDLLKFAEIRHLEAEETAKE